MKISYLFARIFLLTIISLTSLFSFATGEDKPFYRITIEKKDIVLLPQKEVGVKGTCEPIKSSGKYNLIIPGIASKTYEVSKIESCFVQEDGWKEKMCSEAKDSIELKSQLEDLIVANRDPVSTDLISCKIPNLESEKVCKLTNKVMQSDRIYTPEAGVVYYYEGSDLNAIANEILGK